jgi:hypothetical protein
MEQRSLHAYSWDLPRKELEAKTDRILLRGQVFAKPEFRRGPVSFYVVLDPLGIEKFKIGNRPARFVAAHVKPRKSGPPVAGWA